MGFVDLHVHSDASDGTFTPTQVVELAKKECNVLNIQEQDESLENYYINLIGGNRNE